MSKVRFGEVGLVFLLAPSCQSFIGISDTVVISAQGGSYALDISPPPGDCGDGIVQSNEQCDDGNKASADSCSSICRFEPLHVTAGGQQSCALGPKDLAKCWGDNRWHELGKWDTPSYRLTNEGAMGDRMNAAVKAIVTGHRHTCIVLDDNSISCWGGIGSDSSEPAEPRTATLAFEKRTQAISAGAYFTCALFEDGSLTCWGSNDFGQLGMGDALAHEPLAGGVSAKDLRSVNFGANTKVMTHATGGFHACAILAGGDLRCWGYNDFGQLGLGHSYSRGKNPRDMETEQGIVNLGTGRTARLVAAGTNHTCAILDNEALKCWGSNALGQLGLGDNANRGDSPSTMGDSLPAVDLGGAHAKALALGMFHTCALLDDDTVRCWGANDYGQLGKGDTEDLWSIFGVDGGANQFVDFGPWHHAIEIASGISHNCALLEDRTIKCWGRNEYKELGLGDASGRGVSAGQMGDNLQAVDLVF